MSASNIQTITRSSPTVTTPMLLSSQEGKIGFVGCEKVQSYGLEGSYFTFGFHRSASTVEALGRAILASILPNAPEAKMHSSITLEEATSLAEAINNRFHVNATIVLTKASTGSDETVVTELQIQDVRQLRPIIDFIYKKGFESTDGDESVWKTGYIAAADYDVLSVYCTQIEEIIKKYDSLVDGMSQEHVAILRTQCEPMIDAIIETCAGINESSDLKEWSPFFKDPIDQGNLALALLIESCQGYLGATFGEKVNKLGFDEQYQPTETHNNAEKLQTIYAGSKEIESQFTEVGLDIPRLQDQRAALLMLMYSKVEERFGTAQLMSDPVISRAAAAGFEPYLLVPLAVRLFAEGYELDAIPYVFSDTESYMDLNSFNGVLDALEGQFGEEGPYGFQAKHPWTNPEGKKLAGTEAVQRFKEICAKIKDAS